MRENLYGKNAAKVYDLVAYYDYDKAAKSIASSIKGRRVLERGVGIGLTAIPLAKLGFVIDGIDNSNHMLNAARKNLSKESKSVRRRVRLIHQSASNIKLRGPYDAVISQGGVLTFVGPRMESYLKTKTHTYDLMKQISEILREGGRLVINIQSARKELKKAALASGFCYSRRIKWRGKTLTVTHVIEKNGKIMAKQTFEKFCPKKKEFMKMTLAAGFKIIGPNKTGLHYVFEK